MNHQIKRPDYVITNTRKSNSHYFSDNPQSNNQKSRQGNDYNQSSELYFDSNSSNQISENPSQSLEDIEEDANEDKKSFYFLPSFTRSNSQLIKTVKTKTIEIAESQTNQSHIIVSYLQDFFSLDLFSIQDFHLYKNEVATFVKKELPQMILLGIISILIYQLLMLGQEMLNKLFE